MGRFCEFTTEEVKLLWEGMVYDDGLRYGTQAGTADDRLVGEMEAELAKRGEPVESWPPSA